MRGRRCRRGLHREWPIMQVATLRMIPSLPPSLFPLDCCLQTASGQKPGCAPGERQSRPGPCRRRPLRRASPSGPGADERFAIGICSPAGRAGGGVAGWTELGGGERPPATERPGAAEAAQMQKRADSALGEGGNWKRALPCLPSACSLPAIKRARRKAAPREGNKKREASARCSGQPLSRPSPGLARRKKTSQREQLPLPPTAVFPLCQPPRRPPAYRPRCQRLWSAGERGRRAPSQVLQPPDHDHVCVCTYRTVFPTCRSAEPPPFTVPCLCFCSRQPQQPDPSSLLLSLSLSVSASYTLKATGARRLVCSGLLVVPSPSSLSPGAFPLLAPSIGSPRPPLPLRLTTARCHVVPDLDPDFDPDLDPGHRRPGHPGQGQGQGH